ncbi:Amino acid adenylation domain-containing protein [Sulfidibacter corallicola]|uniref:Amino acid adenylation domain-containing protein n=1 Tax=Sulfidibacter corallicola TaxID=2818388 RepID=A0A8A4TT75_SULCO|nr:non-ribosomal peptide synthetase [Sulfidibacter corallicola]QTD52252.1 amino acid adenylation domain-containing protein [Sulfidibacter corallicola]
MSPHDTTPKPSEPADLDQVLAMLRRRDVHVSLEGDQLRLRAPKGALDARLKELLRSVKPALVAHLGRLRAARETIEARPDADRAPLSFAQARLWFVSRLSESGAAYNITGALRLRGPLDEEALARAVAAIVARHAVLRTRFVEVDGRPVQRVAPPPSDVLHRIDLRDREPASAEHETQRLAQNEALHRFDLAKGPLFRAVLAVLAPDHRVLLLNMHHIVADHWSVDVFVKELNALYDAYAAGASSPLPPLPIQYADYARWQVDHLTSDRLEPHLHWWRRALAGSRPDLALPYDFERPASSRQRGRVVPFSLSDATFEGLDALARERRVTRYATLVALYAALLYRYDGRGDLAIGTPIAGRDRAEVAPLIGFFVNTLVLRAKLSWHTTFSDLVDHVQQVVAEAQDHAEAPFEKVVEAVASGSDRELFRTILTHTREGRDEPMLGSAEVTPFEGDRVSGLGARTDLDIYFRESETGVRGFVCYREDLFHEETIVRLVERLTRLASAVVASPRTALSELVLSGEVAVPPFSPEAGNDREEGLAPLSYHQERLWFIDAFETGNVYVGHPTYHNVPLLALWRSDDPRGSGLDVARLGAALQGVVDRHEGLRTRFPSDKRGQVPVEGAEVDFESIALAGEPSAEELLAEALAATRRTFELESAPLVRGFVVTVVDPASSDADTGAPQMAVLALAAHHIAVDRRSLALLLDEWTLAYRDGLGALPSVLEMDYRQFAAHQRAYGDEVLESQMFYWRHRLHGSLQPLVLPTVGPRAGVHVYGEARERFRIEPEMAVRLREWAKGRGTTPFAALLTAFSALLRRYAGHREIVVGTLDDQRARNGARMIAPLANLLVLRLFLDESTAFGDLLGQVDAVERGARAHGAMPFDLLVTRLNPEKDMSRTALFDVLFQVEEDPWPEYALGGGTLQVHETNYGLGKYDVNLLLKADRDGGYEGFWVFNREYFYSFTMAQMVGHFQRLLGEMVARPSALVDRVPLLDEAERLRQAQTWNRTEAAFDSGATIHGLFASQVARTPERIALSCDDRHLTYATLDRRANRIAHVLREMGVGPDTLVAVCLERSIEMVVTMLAVLKAGGAYLNLDPDYPEERLTAMLADSGVRHLVTNAEANLATDREMLRLLLDRDAPHIEAQFDSAPHVTVDPHNLAYCIYTSGSTGRPKGCLVEHRQVVRLMCNDKLPFAFGPDDVWSLFHSYCFDFSVWEMYGALFYGGRVVVVPRHVARDTAAFAALVWRERVTVLSQIPTAFYQFIRECAALDDDCALRYLVFGGEALQPALLRPFHERFPAVVLVNMYGITEITVHASFRQVSTEDITRNAGNIGGPIPTTRLYLLDEAQRLLPVGVPGELFVGGLGVARGYLHRGALTAQRFLPDPYDDRPGARMYRTGDQARLLPDGSFEFLGRLDQQVKVRGFRIELGEVEAALNRLDGVGEAVVAVHGESAEKRLVAYVVADGLGVAEIRKRLAAAMPEHMVPALFVMLDRLPVTPSGKVDRRALPEPVPPSETAPLRPHASPTEEILAGIWREVLGVDMVHGDSEFFELGGHSLLATRVLARVRGFFGVRLPLQVVFEASRLGDLACRIDAARPAERASLPALGREPLPARIPLSFSQQRLWFLERLESPSSRYHMPVLLWLDGKLDVDALRRAWLALTERHASLRTRFREDDEAGEPYQAIDPEGYDPVTLMTIDAIAEARRDEEALRLAREVLARPFDLACDHLLRVVLVRLGVRRHLMALVLHHVVSDGWSLEVLAAELRELYLAFREEKPDPLPELGLQYADYALWQRRHLADAVLAEQFDYWRGALADAPPFLELPRDFATPPRRSYPAGTCPFFLDAKTSAALETLAAAQGATMFMTLLTGFALVLARTSGCRDLVIGTPEANRDRSELESLVGFFVNTLALRIRFESGDSISSLLERVRRTCLAAYDHRDLPFERLVEWLDPDRDPAQAPLFQVMLVWRNIPAREHNWTGLRLTSVQQPAEVAKFDLHLSLTRTDDGIAGVLEYDRELFAESSMLRLLRHFQRIAEAMAARPDADPFALPLVNDEEWVRMQSRLNPLTPRTASVPEPFADGTRTPDVLASFREQVARNPNGPAVSAGSVRWSYAELDQRSSTLAARLHRSGIGPESVVGLYLEREPDLIAAILAVWKAGGAFLPLGSSLGADHLRFLVEDGGAALVIAKDDPQNLFDPQLLMSPDTSEGSMACPEISLLPDQMAYLMYTSGSTGRPKGVAVTRAGLANFLVHSRATYAVDRGALVQGAIGFDATLHPLLAPLTAGGCITLVPEGRELDSLVATFLEERSFGLVHLTPAHLESLSGLLGPRAVRARIMALVSSGEALTASLAADWQHRLPETRVVNEYGPTEAVIDCTMYELAVGEAESLGTTVPIGRALAGSTVYVVDRALRPVPVGTVGELFIGGAQVARGYLGRPSRTATAFVPDPFAVDPGARMYRSGDLVRIVESRDGDLVLEFLGRIDNQVKIRGVRVELRGVEALLVSHSDVAAAAVLARDPAGDGGPGRGRGDKVLVAYLVGREHRTPDLDEVRAWLEKKLPPQAVPEHFEVLDDFPLTPNGKVHRAALGRRPLPKMGTAASVIEPPASPLERCLAEIWCAFLGVAEVGRGDHFFRLGGHSLTATRVVAALRHRLGIEMPLRWLFEAPRLCDLAERVATLHLDEDGDAAVAARITPRGYEEIPLSGNQKRLWFLSRLEGPNAAYNMPVVLRLRGSLDRDALRRAASAIAERHEVLRTTIEDVDGEPRARLLTEHPMPLVEVAVSEDESARGEAFVRDWVNARTAAPFDPARDCPLRVELLCLSRTDHVLVLMLHHIAGDGWSQGLLLRELSALYPAFAGGEPVDLPPLPVQFADVVAWQARRMDEDRRRALLDYWRAHLDGAPPLLELPTDRPRPTRSSTRGAMHRFALSAELTSGLNGLAVAHDCTLFMVLLAGFAEVLARWSGRRDLVIGTPVANRTSAEQEQLIGFFANTLPLRLQPEARGDLATTLASVRHACLEGYAHADLAFEELVEALQPRRDLSYAPIFQVMFVLQNFTEPELEHPDLEVVNQAREVVVSKFDMTLAMEEGPDGLFGAIEYNRDLFDEETVARLGEHLSRLWSAMVERPEEAVSRLPMLPDWERDAVMADGNPRPRDWGAPYEVESRFAGWVRQRPEATAIVYGDRRWTYAELDAEVARLTEVLASRGVGPEVPVVVMAERDPDLAAAFLAVQRLGAVFVGLDPAYPQRFAPVLRDCGGHLVVTHAALRDRLPEGDFDVLVWDEPSSMAVPEPNPNIERRRPHPENLAYLTYTSGSTGEPKGVQLTRAGLFQSAMALQAFMRVEPCSVFYFFASLNFDSSVIELALVFSSGAALDLGPDRERLLGDPLAAYVARNGITHLIAVPSAVATVEPCGDLPRCVILAGEVCPESLVRRWLPGRRIVNGYGPAEHTVAATLFACDGRPGATPIGSPVPNARTFVLDSDLQLAPLGIAGQLALAGPQVARGYRNRPGATAAVFVPNPFGPPGSRMYLTGDLVRRRPVDSDGEDRGFDFVGRLDDQVKIRGRRIEPGEVEAWLRGREDVADAVVVVRRERQMPYLAAYVTAMPEREPTVMKLRRLAAQSLPDYLQPSAWVLLDDMPRNASDKPDRDQLPEPGREAFGAVAFIPPRDALERELAALYSELLEVPSVGAYDGFFELGGHSLLTVRLVARIESRFGRRLPLAELFRHGSVAEVAELLRQDGAEPRRAPLVPLHGRGIGSPWFLLPGTGGNLVYFHELAQALGTRRKIVYGLQAVGLDGDGSTDRVKPHDSIEAIVAANLEALLDLDLDEAPIQLVGHSFGCYLAFEMACRLRQAGRPVAPLILLDTPAPRGDLDPPPDMDDADWLVDMATMLAGFHGRDCPLTRDDLAGCTWHSALARFAERLVADELLPAGTTAEDLEGPVAVFRAQSRMVYRPQTLGDFDLNLVRTRATAAGAASKAAAEDAQSWGWARLTSGAMHACWAQGDHATMLRHPHVEGLADLILSLAGSRGRKCQP